MCGFVGMEKGRQNRLVGTMLEKLAHRGPDGRGLWCDTRHTLGHTRLSIIDLEGGAQPMSDARGRRHVVFNGEIYNYRELRRDLGAKRFRTASDTEAIVQLAKGKLDPQQWVSRLDGMFAFALVDGPDLVLARDPLGIKPLYTGRLKGALVFASELKALPSHTECIDEFPPGHVFTSNNGLQLYYRIPSSTTERIDVESARRGLLERLDAAVLSHLVSDVPLGVFLSGGVDSSLIAALASRHKKPLDTFFVGTVDSPDRAPARLMAQRLKTRHHERDYTIDEALAILPEVIYRLESFDCALVRSAIPNYFLARLAREHVKVALSGEGADELFAGYEYLERMPSTLLQEELTYITGALHNTNLQRCDRMSMAHGLEVRVPFLSVAVVDYASRLPLTLKRHGTTRRGKWILRKVAERLLPRSIAWRRKVKFAVGAGLGDRLAQWAETEISDREFARRREIAEGTFLRSKEELLYYRFFKSAFPNDDLIPLVGRSRSL